MENDIISYIEYSMHLFTPSQRSIANYFLKANSKTDLNIEVVAEKSYVSPASVSRFVKKIGYDNYKQFLFVLVKTIETRSAELDDDHLQQLALWNNHKSYYENTYISMAKINVNNIANRMRQSKKIVSFGLGEMQNVNQIFLGTVGIFMDNVSSCSYLEQLFQIVRSKLSHNDLLILFYNHPHYKHNLDDLIVLAKKRFIQVMVVTTSESFNTHMHAMPLVLYNEADSVYSRFAATLYSPFLIFIDSIVQSLERNRNNPKPDYYDVY